LAEPFEVSQPAISRHLKVLERAGLVSTSQDGQRRPRRLEPEQLSAATEWIERHREVFEHNYRRLDALLDEMKSARRPATPTHEEHGMPTITPFLWFDAPLAEPIAYYKAIFPDFKVHHESPMSAAFEMHGQRFHALNGGPKYTFTDAISFFIDCADQAEVDYYWERLTAEGSESQCGWLKDKYGLSWQVIPKALGRYMSDPDRPKVERVVQAMLQMKKIDVAALDRAADAA
jgi:predicted 3-demethylubiquinone-9 3-methyltransferase (glyoxalase superfamily)